MEAFVHSGNLGDIVYSLHFAKQFTKNIWNKNAFKLYLRVNVKGNSIKNHPYGNVYLNKESAIWAKSFFESQPYISSVEIIDSSTKLNKDVFSLDSFRNLPISFNGMYIPKWYYYLIHCLMKDLSFEKPWIKLGVDNRSNNKIVISRTLRYRNKNINYKLLKNKQNECIFIGLPEEYNEFKKNFECEFIQPKSALEAGNLINSCKLFIGNQSFFYSLAESAKVKRLCELDYNCPNTFSHGGICADIIYNEQFQNLINNI